MPAPIGNSFDPLVRFALTHLRISGVGGGRQQHEHGYQLESRTVPDTNIIYVTRGRVVWVIDALAYPLGPGELVLVPPHTPHFAFSQTKRVTLGSIHLEATLPGGQDVLTLLRPPRHQTFTDRPLAQYLQGALGEFDRPNRAMQQAMLQPWARLIMLELLSDNAARGLLDLAPVDPMILEVLEKLDASIAAPVRLADLAAWAGFSAQHLNRLFKSALGITPLAYLTRARMQRAAELLVDGRLTVAAVGKAVGYPDPYYFSRVFKQHLDLSPAAYQRRMGSDSLSASSDSVLA